jgi:hypothetical protein
MSSDSDKPASGSLWQPVSSGTVPPGKVTDVTPEPVKSSSSTVASSAASSVGTASSKPASSATGGSPPRTPPSDRVPPSSPPPGNPPRRRGLNGVAGAIVFVVATLAVLYALAPHWLPALMTRAGIATNAPAASSTAADAERQKIAAQFADINARLATLKGAGTDQGMADQVKALQGQIQRLMKEQDGLADLVGQLSAREKTNADRPNAPVAPDPALGERLDAIQRQIDTLSATSNANKSLRGDIDALTAELGKAADRASKIEQRLAALEQSVASRQNLDQRSVDAARASAVMALAARLRSNIDAGRGFGNDLASLKTLVGGDAELAALLTTLEPLSGGTEGIASLRQSFPPVARAVVTAGDGDAAQSWWDKALARLTSVVSVRRVGADVAGDSVEAHVARAAGMLDAGRLDAAVAELKPLTGNAAKAAAPWLAKAERQLAAIAAADKLQAQAADRLARIEQQR